MCGIVATVATVATRAAYKKAICRYTCTTGRILPQVRDCYCANLHVEPTFPQNSAECFE